MKQQLDERNEMFQRLYRSVQVQQVEFRNSTRQVSKLKAQNYSLQLKLQELGQTEKVTGFEVDHSLLNESHRSSSKGRSARGRKRKNHKKSKKSARFEVVIVPKE